MSRTLARLALPLLLALAPAAPAASNAENHILYLVQNEITDASLRQRVQQFIGEDTQPFVIAMGEGTTLFEANRRLTPASRRDADDVALARQVRDAPLLVLSGGTFMQWVDTIYPRGPVTEMSTALRHCFQSNKPIIASGGACAFLSGGVMIDRTELRDPGRNPRQLDGWEPRLAVGIGPECLFDSDDWSNGAPLRLLKAMADTSLDLGAHFVGEVGLDYDRVSQELTVLGPGSILLFDLRRARTLPEGLREGRLSRLLQGDRWTPNEQILRPAAGQHMLPARDPEVARPATTPDWSEQPGPNAVQLIAWLEAPAAARETRAARDSRWTLWWDSRSRRGPAAETPGPLTWTNVPFDCRWPKR